MATYENLCEQAATDQGLDPLTEELSRRGVPHGVAQTGGYTMVATVPHGELGLWGVINDGGQWLILWYPGDCWKTSEYEEDDLPMFLCETVDQAMEVITKPHGTV